MEVIIKNISKSYSTKVILSDLSFEIQDSSIVTIAGKNASGKSTLLKIIIGLIQQDSGSVTYVMDDKRIPYNAAKKNIGFAGNNELLIESLTAFDYFNFIKKIYRISNDKFKNRLNNLINKFGIKPDVFSKCINTYSTGYRNITEIFGVFIHNPLVIVLDEPFNSLDIEFKAILKDYIVYLKKEKHTIVIATHNKDFINNYSGKIISL